MAHIVVVTAGLTGLFNASLALMTQLIAAGHRLTYASCCQNPEKLQEPLSALSIQYVQLGPWEMPTETATGSRWTKWQRLLARQQKAAADLGMAQFSQALKKLAPNLLLIDIEMHPHIMTAVIDRYTVALLCPFISIWQQPHLPPIHTPIIPGQGWRGSRPGIKWSWWRYGWQKWQQEWRDRIQTSGLSYAAVLQRYAQQIGYPFQPRYGFSQWLVPFPHKDLPILCLHALELDFPHSPQTAMRHVGPMVYEPRAANSQTLSVNAADQSADLLGLKTFLAKRSGEFLIYCGCSSFTAASQQFLQQLSAIATTHPHWDFVIGLGQNNADKKLATAWPKNAFTLPWAPQLQLLKQADCAIINAGAHSITECIHFGVPMLLYPLPRDDQSGNAARVVFHGLGLAIWPKDSVPAPAPAQQVQIQQVQMQQHLQNLLTDSAYRLKGDKMRQQFQRYKQNKTAIAVVESLLPPPTASYKQEGIT